MNILISVNSKFLEIAKTMLYSLQINTKEKIVVYMINLNLKETEIKDFNNYLIENCSIKLNVIDIGYELINKLPIVSEQFSIEMYFRIFAQFLLPNDLDRILWLDADIIVMRDIIDFYYQDFEDKCFVVCRDRKYTNESILTIKKNLEIPNYHDYFNSGVLLMNLEKLRKITEIKSISEICNKLKSKLTYPDQDLLNYIYAGKVKYNDWEKYNYQLFCDSEIDNNILNGVSILHYCGQKKPWIYQNICDSSKYYWKIRYMQGDKKNCRNIYKNILIDQITKTLQCVKQIFYVLFHKFP